MLSAADLVRLFLGLMAVSWNPPVAGPDPGSEECSREAIVFVDSQTILFLEEGREVNLALVSTGRPGHGTPLGDFEVLYRRRAPVSSTYDVRMPYWLCIEPSGQIGLHQASASAMHLLGTRSSRGCVRMGKVTAAWSYDWLRTGSEVSILPEGPRCRQSNSPFDTETPGAL